MTRLLNGRFMYEINRGCLCFVPVTLHLLYAKLNANIHFTLKMLDYVDRSNPTNIIDGKVCEDLINLVYR